MKTALITGASQGIGNAVAKRLSREGYAVALLARSSAELTTLQNQIMESGGVVVPLPCDVADPDAVEEAFEKLQGEWEQLDFIFNNAGKNIQGTLEPSLNEMKALYDVNVFGAYSILQHAVPWLKSQGSGTIINLVSVAGITGFAGVGAYCSSKFALRGLNQSLHHELEPLGIRVCAISPSWVDTRMADHCPFKAEKRIRPEDIADTVLYILNLGPNVSIEEITVGCRSDLG
ncbi:SDR family oxidoreductase [bacterium]|nr:SDR family oxidoreductase [bacterium]